MEEQLINSLKKNLNWFLKSGIMRPNDGFWGVAERIVSGVEGEALEKINQSFPCQTKLSDDKVILEHRRADCCFEVALMFDLASEFFNDSSYKKVTKNILSFLLERSGMRDSDEKSETYGLWEWAMPKSPAYWTDDNSWVIICLLFLADRGYGVDLRKKAYLAASKMSEYVKILLDHVNQNGKDIPLDSKFEKMLGMRLNPHWLGLSTMALALTDKAAGKNDYHELISRYYSIVLDGPPSWDKESCVKGDKGFDWSVSEYCYLAMTGAVSAMVYEDKSIGDIAIHAGNILLAKQHDDGHFASNHYEAPEGEQYADMIYTQNWATLALQHLALYFPDEISYMEAFKKSALFLTGIQDESSEKVFDGCWRGMYDCELKDWGGGDKYEGGQGSIYSGWTNAPISIAFLFELMGKNFLQA